MTPPHIEKAARAIMAQRHLPDYDPNTNAWPDSKAISIFMRHQYDMAVADATLVWNLARKATLEEAASKMDAIAADLDLLLKVQKKSGTGDSSTAGKALEAYKEAAAAIRALSVEG